MRRISVFFAFAAILLAAVVGYTYKLRLDKAHHAHTVVPPQIKPGEEAFAPTWHYQKDDPQTSKPVVVVDAKSFQATRDPSTSELHELALRLYDKGGSSYTYVKGDTAFFDERSGVMRSQGPVHIIMKVPADKNAEDPAATSKLVHITTSGIVYETKTGKATTDQPASFVFSDGDGQAVGVDYDPNTKILHLKSKVSLDWIGGGPAENKMHIEAGDLVYKEAEGKIYLSPWSKLVRQTTTIQARNSVVLLQDGRLHQIDADRPVGVDNRDDRHTEYSGETMTALFDEDGNLVQIVANKNAKVVATQAASRTTMTGDKADLRFTVNTAQQPNGTEKSSSDLHLVLADGRAVAESVPLPQPGVQLPDTRILRSEHIELEMRPDGKTVQEIRTPSQAQLEFKPNRPDQPHRTLDASHLRVLYGANSYVDSFLAWNAVTHTDKPASASKGKASGANPPALTWSDQLVAKFVPNSNQIATIDQTGNFRYQEGTRKASASKALLEQTVNRITLIDRARVLDDTGSASGDKIVMNQANGDMDASGHVMSTHQPDRNQRPGTSMLDNSQAMQAKADEMQTRENNSRVHYEGHAVMWQGANRIAADVIDIDRDDQTLEAKGNVVSELVDNRSPAAPDGAAPAQATPAAATPIFTVVYAPELRYRDDTRIATYTGGVKLVRDRMTVTSKSLEAFLTPKTAKNSGDSSLDHAFASGDVNISEVIAPNRTRTGVAEHCEYYTSNDKVVLNGGSPHMVDTLKGTTTGRQLTYFSNDDRLVVEGERKTLAYTDMKKK